MMTRFQLGVSKSNIGYVPNFLQYMSAILLSLSREAFTNYGTEPQQGEPSHIELRSWHCSGVVNGV